jgi:hypothetical protein
MSRLIVINHDSTLQLKKLVLQGHIVFEAGVVHRLGGIFIVAGQHKSVFHR